MVWKTKEPKVARYLEMHGQATAVEIANALSMKVHAVQYILEKLHREGALRRRVLINAYRLGLQRLAVFVSMLGMSEKGYQNLLHTLRESTSVALLLELSGKYQLEVNLIGTNIATLRSQLDVLSQNISSVSVAKEIALQVEHQIYGTKVLGTFSAKQPKNAPIKTVIGYHANVSPIAIDELDHQILKALMDDNKHSLRTLAKELSIPASTCEYRVRKLEESHVIEGYTYLLEGFSLLHYVVLLHMKLLDSTLRKKLKKFCEEHVSVFYLVENVGSWDFELGLVVREPTEVMSLLHKLHSELGERIAHTDVISLLRRIKVRDYPFSELQEWI